MMSENINLIDFREGDILAEDAVNMHGVVLVSNGTLLNDYIVNKLRVNRIERIAIYRNTQETMANSFYDSFHKSHYNTVVNIKSLFQSLLAGKFLEYEHVLSITKDIHNYINLGDKIIKCLTKLKDTDEYTYYHSVNVAFYSMLISNWLNLTDIQTEKAVQAGLLHDLGKTGIPNDILNKQGILTQEEFEVIKKHTILGYELVNHINGIDQDIKMAVLLHHERMDGSGYPYHYKPEHKDFNLFSKIVAIADVYDAMTSDRVYKKKSTPFEVFEMFQTVGMSMFDTKIMKLFMDKLSVYLVGSEVQLSNGELGKIVYIPLHSVTSPIIQTSTEYIDLARNRDITILKMI